MYAATGVLLYSFHIYFFSLNTSLFYQIQNGLYKKEYKKKMRMTAMRRTRTSLQYKNDNIDDDDNNDDNDKD